MIARNSFTFLILLLSSLQLQGEKRHVTKYEGVLHLGEVSFAAGSSCVSMHLHVSDDFLSGLEKIEQAGTVRFRNKSKWVNAFPDTILLKVTAERMSCSTTPAAAGRPPTMRRPQSTIPGPLAPEDLRFQAEWVGSNGERVAEIVSTKSFKEPWQELRDKWEYTLVLKSKDALLSEKLMVRILAADGKEQGRVSAQL